MNLTEARNASTHSDAIRWQFIAENALNTRSKAGTNSQALKLIAAHRCLEESKIFDTKYKTETATTPKTVLVAEHHHDASA